MLKDENKGGTNLEHISPKSKWEWANMLTLSVVIVPNQNWSPDHTIQSELLGEYPHTGECCVSNSPNHCNNINPTSMLE